jgi:hypothetical protein
MKQEDIALIALITSSLSAIASAVSARASWKNSVLTNLRLQRDSEAFIDIQFTPRIINAEWTPSGDDPKTPQFVSRPQLEIVNFGPMVARAVRTTFTLETELPPQFLASTGPPEPTLPINKKFYVDRSPERVTFRHLYQQWQAPWLPLAKTATVTPIDFLSKDKSVSVTLPDAIQNEIAVYLLAQHLFRRGDLRGPNEKRFADFGSPVLVVDVQWQNLDGASRSRRAKWNLTDQRMIMRTSLEAVEGWDLLNSDYPPNIDPEWAGLQFGGELRRVEN